MQAQVVALDMEAGKDNDPMAVSAIEGCYVPPDACGQENGGQRPGRRTLAEAAATCR